MKIKSLVVTTILLTSTIWSQAQQINPVPDYVFRNQMSVGRNAVTDTAAYFSIGPRYGATKGFMPPIVGDTATFSSGKRNGLLIFSVQKNKFLYWDSVRVQWSDMAGSSGSYIVAGDTSAMLTPYLRKADTTSMLTAYLRKGDTASMLSPYYRSATASAALALKLNISDTSSMLGNYIRHAGYGLTKSGQSFLVDTLNIATRAWRQKGIDSVVSIIPAAGVGGSGTTNRIAKFTASGTLGNGSIADSASTVAMTILGTNNVGIGTVTPQYRLHTFGTTGIRAETSSGNISTGIDFASAFVGGRVGGYYSYPGGGAIGNNVFGESANGTIQNIVFSESVFPLKLGTIGAGPLQFYSNSTERLRITSGGNVGIGTTSPTAYTGYTTLALNNNTNGSVLDFMINGSVVGQLFNDASNFYVDAKSTAPLILRTNSTERLRIFANGRVFIGASPTDAGYQLDVNGTLRSVNGANFATSSGRVGIGTASPQYLVEAYQNGLADVIVNSAADNNSAILSVFNSGGTSGNFAQLRAYGNTTGGTLFGSSTNKMISLFSNGDALMTIGTISATSLAFGTANAERARFSGAGELLINTTSDAGDYKLQVSGNIYNTGSAVLAATSGNVGIGTASPVGDGTALNIYGSSFATIKLQNSTSGATATDGTDILVASSDLLVKNRESGSIITYTANTERGRINSAGEWIIDASGTDAGDYKLQVVGNARVGTGKLDIASNTVYGLGVARSGTSEVAGQIYNSSGILYFGAESSTGGGIFSGSSAYAGVIGTGANYPLQFAVNNITRGGFSTSGNLLLGFTTDSYFLKLQVNGSIFSNNQFFGQGANAQLSIDSSANISPLYVSAHSLTGSSAQGLFYGSTTWNTTGNPSLLDLNVTNTASGATSNYIKITDGTNTFRVTKAAEVVTAAPSGGSIKPWKLGEAATVSPTSPNRTIRVEIDGTVYYLHAKTTND